MDKLISHSLKEKLYWIYEIASESQPQEQKVGFNIESRENKSFFKIMGFQMDDWENFDKRDVLKYESKFIKNMLLP